MNKIHRVIDANINRASEGLRVLEEIFRLFYNNKNFVNILKNLRHKIRQAISDTTYILSRDISSDSGKDSFTITEKKRESLEDIFFANSKRVEESLRVLEEFFKIENQNKSYLFKNIRFEIYKLGEEFFSVKNKFKNFLNKIELYTIVDSRFCKKDIIKTSIDILKGGAKILQLRDKVLNDKELLNKAKEIKNICEDFNAIFIVNDRIDIAFFSNAHGVHLGQNDLPVNYAKDILGFNKIFGLSTHNLAQVKEAEKLNIDYIGFGPIFPTKSKENPDPTVGVEKLKEVKESFNLPICAIGGINFSNIHKVLKAKPEMICVMSGITLQENIKKEVKEYRRIINDTANICKK